MAVSDEYGGIYNSQGLDLKVVRDHFRQSGQLNECPDTEAISNQELLELDVEVLIPAAIENQITSSNADQVRPES